MQINICDKVNVSNVYHTDSVLQTYHHHCLRSGYLNLLTEDLTVGRIRPRGSTALSDFQLSLTFPISYLERIITKYTNVNKLPNLPKTTLQTYHGDIVTNRAVKNIS